jgi:ABC-type antimicrobial peptide transport system ATPase subunit
VGATVRTARQLIHPVREDMLLSLPSFIVLLSEKTRLNNLESELPVLRFEGFWEG